MSYPEANVRLVIAALVVFIVAVLAVQVAAIHALESVPCPGP